MAYREVQMWEVLNVLRRIGRGESAAAVARATGHTRRTVRRYVVVAEEGPGHRRSFRVQCVIAGAVAGEGTGFSKKDAQQEAARLALSAIRRREGG